MAMSTVKINSYDDYQNALKNYSNLIGEQRNYIKNQTAEESGRLKNQFEDSAKQAYIRNAVAKRDLPQQLAAQGISGGMTESGLLSLENSYGNEYSKYKGQYDDNLAQLRRQESDKLFELSTAEKERQQQLYDQYRAEVLAQQRLEEQREYEAKLLAEQRAYEEAQAQKAYERQLSLVREKNSSSGVEEVNFGALGDDIRADLNAAGGRLNIPQEDLTQPYTRYMSPAALTNFDGYYSPSKAQLAALQEMVRQGKITEDEHDALIRTGNYQKYV